MGVACSDAHAEGSPGTSTPFARTVAPTVLAQAPASRHNSRNSQDNMQHNNSLPIVRCSLFLKLPDPMERQWLHSDLAVRTYTLSDRMACVCSILINSAVLFRVSHIPSSWLGLKGLMAVYIAAAVLQLGYMTRNQALYYNYRLIVIWSNRLLRLLMMVGQVMSYSAADVHAISAEFCSSGNNHDICRPTRTGSSGSGSSSVVGVADGSGSELLSGSWQAAVLMARPAVSLLLAVVAHANYVLPFRHVLLLQLVTFGVSLQLSRALACWYVSVPLLRDLATNQCAAIHSFMHAGKLLHAGAYLTWQPSHLCQQGMSAVSVMIIYINVIMLLWLPCCATYHLEWSSKDIFVRRQEKLLSRSWPRSAAVILLVAHMALVATWYAVHFVVGQVPLRCREDGLLTW